MRPLILEFSEVPTLKAFDFSLIEYSKKLNLSVIKGTLCPAISFLNLETETFTRTMNETSDSDSDLKSTFKQMMDTSTETKTYSEVSDGDDNYSTIRLLMDTQIVTESIEPTESDK